MARAVLAGVAVGIALSGALVGAVVPLTGAMWHTPTMVWGMTTAVVGLSVLITVRAARRRRE